MRKMRIAAKIYLAFGSIFVLAVVASSVGWKGFEDVTRSQSSVIDQAIPGLRQAHRLSSLNASIGALAQQLQRVQTEEERHTISTALFSEVRQMNLLIDNFETQGFSLGSLQSLRDTVSLIEDRLQQQDILVRQRIEHEARFAELSSGLIATTESLNNLADSLVANAAATTTAITSSLYDLVEDEASDQQLYSVFDRLVEVDLDAMERMYELRLRSANLNGLFNRVAEESNIDELNQLRQSVAETLSILKRRVSEINDPQRRQRANELLGAMEVDNGPLYVYGIFETRVSLIQIGESLDQLSLETGAASQALNGIVSELNATGGELINRVSTTAEESLTTGRQWFGVISVVLLMVAAILWWFVKHNVVRRLLSLESATRSITQGDYDVNIAVEGHDELTDMGRALHGFRNNAIDNQKLDEELRQHRAHLEELVEERSEQLRTANEMLSEEVRNHELAREKAEQANQAKTAFLATMSHELRTPLSGALGTLKLLSDTRLKDEQDEYVRLINAANVSLLDIVNDILGYSQLEAGKLKLENRRFDLVELVNNVVGLMQVSVNEKHNQLQLDMNLGNSIWLSGDSGKLHQILINLIGNANKFTDAGTITVQITCDNPEAESKAKFRFAVIDTGIGIAQDKQQEIFHAFTQVDTSSARRYGGIGLGLAICERLVDAMGGEIRLQSELGQGTRVSFELELESGVAADIADSGAEPALAANAPLTVLMVEDDATNSLVTRNYLEHLGHHVLAARTGEEALRLLDQGGMSIVLLDISLPGIDGLTILQYIRTHADAAIATMPVVAMSAHVFSEEVDHYLAAGMNGFLGKPFSMADLELAISQAFLGDEVVIAKSGQPGKVRSIKPINTAIIEDDVKRLGLERVTEFADIFFHSADAMKQELVEAMRQPEFSDQQRLAHKLCGSAGNFGLETLCDLLTRLETQAERQEPSPPEQIDRLEVIFDEAIEALNAFLAEAEPNASTSGEKIRATR